MSALQSNLNGKKYKSMNTENKNDLLIPPNLLKNSKKILFVTHLAIGDFTYWQNYFKAFAKEFPHIKVDLWIDEVRRTHKFWKWKSLKHYALNDWIENCGIFNKIYKETYSWFRFNTCIKKACKENYPIVVSLATIRFQKYAKYARAMSPNGFICGVFNSDKKYACKTLDAKIPLSKKLYKSFEHVSDMYALWFKKLFDIDVAPKDRIPFINIPERWVSFAKLKFFKWGIEEKEKRIDKVVFVNAFAKDKKRCWPVSKAIKLIKKLRAQQQYKYAYFIINSMPDSYDEVQSYLRNHSSNRVILFTAKENLFQLPAVISLCDLVVSVETSVMHLASALNIPVVALMRQKNPEWAPFRKENREIVWAKNRHSWIKDIKVDAVSEKVVGL